MLGKFNRVNPISFLRDCVTVPSRSRAYFKHPVALFQISCDIAHSGDEFDFTVL